MAIYEITKDQIRMVSETSLSTAGVRERGRSTALIAGTDTNSFAGYFDYRGGIWRLDG